MERQRDPTASDMLVPIATGLRLRGNDGRLTASLVPGGIDQLHDRADLLVGRARGAMRRLGVEKYKVYGRKVILKFRGIDSAALAEPLVGLDILMPCNGLVDLPEGDYYIFELVGLKVQTREGRVIGTVRDVVETEGTPLLAIEPLPGAGGRGAQDEILLPIARSICANIDIASRCITVDPPEGLLELYGI